MNENRANPPVLTRFPTPIHCSIDSPRGTDQ
jgi:hypothetical protein